jgi:hypothetical protein
MRYNLNDTSFQGYNHNWPQMLQDVENVIHVSAVGMSPAQAKFIALCARDYPAITYEVDCDEGTYRAASSMVNITGTYRRVICVIPDQAQSVVCGAANANDVALSPEAIELTIREYASRMRLLEILPFVKEFASNLSRISWGDEGGADITIHMPRSKHYRDIIPWAMEYAKSVVFTGGHATHNSNENIIGGMLLAQMCFTTVKEIKAGASTVPGANSDMLARPGRYADFYNLNERAIYDNVLQAENVNMAREHLVQHIYFFYNIHIRTVGAFELAKDMLCNDEDLVRMVNNSQPTNLWCALVNCYKETTTSCATIGQIPSLEKMDNSANDVSGYLLATMFGLNPEFDLDMACVSQYGYDTVGFLTNHPTYNYSDGLFWGADCKVFYFGLQAQHVKPVTILGTMQAKKGRAKNKEQKESVAPVKRKGRAPASRESPPAKLLWGDEPEDGASGSQARDPKLPMGKAEDQFKLVESRRKVVVDIEKVHTVVEIDDMIEEAKLPKFTMKTLPTRVLVNPMQNIKYCFCELLYTMINNLKTDMDKRETFASINSRVKGMVFSEPIISFLDVFGPQTLPDYANIAPTLRQVKDTLNDGGQKAIWANVAYNPATASMELVAHGLLNDTEWVTADGEHLCAKFEYRGWL